MRRGRAAGRDERDAGVVQAADELVEPGLVVDARPGRGGSGAARRSRRSWPNRTFLSLTVKPSRAIRPTASTSIARSATLIRSCSDSTVVVVLRPAPRAWHDRAGVDAGVDDESVQPVTLTPYASASRAPCIPGNDGSSAGWVLTHAAAERGEERRPDQLHEAGRARPGRARTPRRRRSARASQSSRSAKSRDPVHERRDAGPLGPGQPLDAVAVGADGDDLRAVRRVGARRRAGPGGWCRTRRRGRPDAQVGRVGTARESIDRDPARRSARASRGSLAAATRSSQAAEQAAEAEAPATACTSTSATNGPTSLHPARARPSRRPARPARANADAGQHAADAAAQRRPRPSAAVGWRRWHARPRRRRRPRAARASSQRASRPASGRRRAGRRAAGTAAAARARPRSGETIVPVPTAKPGPSR